MAAKVGRLISEPDREDAEEYRNTMETIRQVAEEQCDIRERSHESVRDDERQTAGASTQPLLQRMDRFEAHLAQLASRLHGREALLKSLQELLRRGMTKK